MLALAAGAVCAEPADLTGRLNYAGYRSRTNCTGALVGDGHVVTAAHCVPDVGDAEMHLLLGYDRMEFSRDLTAVSADYEVMPGRDVAVLCGAEPGTEGLAGTDGIPPVGTPVTVLGYGHPRSEILQETDCAVMGAEATRMLLDCRVTSGTSGGPVVNAAGVFLGVTSASGPGVTVVETIIPADIEAICGGE